MGTPKLETRTIELPETKLRRKHHIKIMGIRADLQQAINKCMKRAEIDTGYALVRILEKL